MNLKPVHQSSEHSFDDVSFCTPPTPRRWGFDSVGLLLIPISMRTDWLFDDQPILSIADPTLA
jgi:hypothetical protein